MLLAVTVAVQTKGPLSSNDLHPWWLVGSAVLGLLPVLLLVLSSVQSVEAAGVRVAFDAVQTAVRVAEKTTRTTITENLGAPAGVNVMDSAGDTIITALKSATIGDVVIVDLGEGRDWWETRLLLLTSGAVRLGHPRAIVFTAVSATHPYRYLGWAPPSQLLRSHLTASVDLRQAYQRAHRQQLLASLALPDHEGGPERFPWQTPPDGPFPTPAGLEGDFAPERALMHQLGPLESPDTQRHVTVSRLNELFAAILHQESVDQDDPQRRWIDLILKSTADYFAVTTGHRRFVSLVPRRSAVNAVLLSLVHGPPTEDRGL
ncbi:hypothetical protein [Streptomyces sp. NPDC055189]